MAAHDFLGLVVVVSGSTQEVARFHEFLQQFDGNLTLDAGVGSDTGAYGVATLRWISPGSELVTVRPAAVRGPRRGAKNDS